MASTRGIYYFVVVICESCSHRLVICGAPENSSPSPVQCIGDEWIQLSGSHWCSYSNKSSATMGFTVLSGYFEKVMP